MLPFSAGANAAAFVSETEHGDVVLAAGPRAS
jgi:hypothetical protein